MWNEEHPEDLSLSDTEPEANHRSKSFSRVPVTYFRLQRVWKLMQDTKQKSTCK
jgi:hypothetical protein